MNDPSLPMAPRIISAKSTRFAAQLFHWGNIVAILIPVPLGVLWIGASMALYAMNRHHPDPRVGHQTQQAAYRFYGLVGFVVVIATFYGTEPIYWLVTWIVLAAILVPWSLWDLWRLRREQWHDITLEGDNS
jgi:hypothetical protein